MALRAPVSPDVSLSLLLSEINLGASIPCLFIHHWAAGLWVITVPSPGAAEPQVVAEQPGDSLPGSCPAGAVSEHLLEYDLRAGPPVLFGSEEAKGMGEGQDRAHSRALITSPQQ